MSDERQVGEYDDEYMEKLLGLEPGALERERYATVADHDPALAKQLVEAGRNELEIKKQRARTYLTSEMPVRPCTADCPKRDSCADFRLGRVADRELCRPELRKMKKWQRAFRSGNLDELKDDVGTVAGGMAVQLVRLLEIVNTEGSVIETDKIVAGGYSYKEKMVHPGLTAASKIAKDLGIDLTNFLMTPKAAKDAGPPNVFNIANITVNQVHERFAARFADKKPIEVGPEAQEAGSG